MRLTRLLGAAIVLVAACGDGGGSAGVPEFRSDCPEPSDAGKLTLDVTTPQPLRMGRAVTWNLIVVNAGDEEVTMVFPSGQDGDVVLKQGAEEFYRWSLERNFTQAIRCVTLDPGDRVRLSLENDILEINAGEYELSALVAARPTPPMLTKTVRVDP